MGKFPWNEKFEYREFWDPQSQNEMVTVGTLKDRLSNPAGMRQEDVLKDCAEGIVMVMNEIEKIQTQARISSTDSSADKEPRG